MISESFANRYDNGSRIFYQSQRAKRWREMAVEIYNTCTAVAEVLGPPVMMLHDDGVCRTIIVIALFDLLASAYLYRFRKARMSIHAMDALFNHFGEGKEKETEKLRRVEKS